jgi:uncharacterized membrane protein YraQ (UPF0718 family)
MDAIAFLAVSLLALLFGPLVYAMAREKEKMLSLLDGFIFVAISGLVLVYLLPESFSLGGWVTLIFALAGLFGPTLIERLFQRAARQAHIAAIVLGLAGICLHALIDGSALAPQQHSHEGHTLLPFAVILHRLPVGLTIWWLLRPAFGVRVAATILGLVGTTTVVGFALGSYLTADLSSQGLAYFQALVAGSLLHVVFHQPHLNHSACGCGPPTSSNKWYEGSGALLGLLLMALLVSGGSPLHSESVISRSFSTFMALALGIAPVLLLAYVAAGMLNAFLPHSSVGWMYRGSKWMQSARGMAVGLPFPVCSCGVVPLYQTLVRKGAPATAAMAFLVATPELGVDAVLVSIPLLGGEMTAIRVVSAALVALAVGRLVGGIIPSKPPPISLPVVTESGKPQTLSVPVAQRVWNGLKVGLGEVVDFTGPWILFGLCIAAIAHPLLESGWLARIPDFWQVPLFTLIGLPTYVCASGATPLVAVLLVSGVSPGAALAFLLTGPATNVTTFGVMGRLHGRKIALIFSLTIIGLALSLGYLVNFLFPDIAKVSMEQISGHVSTPFNQICLALLASAYFFSLLRRGARHFIGELFFNDDRALDLTPHYHSERKLA